VNPEAEQLYMTHIITGLSGGGAEGMLYRLLSVMDRDKFTNRVISLTEGGLVRGQIEALGIPVLDLGMRPGIPDPLAIIRLARHLHRQRPAIVQTWMYHADLVGGLAAWYSGIPVVWNIRHTYLDPRYYKRSTIWTARLCAWLSARMPRAIVVCSESARKVHIHMGYIPDKMTVIPNGFDLNHFKPDLDAYHDIRQELNLVPQTLLVGMAARFHPLKDHANFFRAAREIHKVFPDVNFLLCGDQISWDNPDLVELIQDYGMHDQVHLLGHRQDVQRIIASLDLLCMSSSSEAFPNVVAEAMACGIPCVVTDVGDAAEIVGPKGWVVPPSDPSALATSCLSVLQLPSTERIRWGEEARVRVRELYSLENVTVQYQTLYKTVVSQARHNNKR
jgi:glycosyltransferase involved in cell wall biosynthesis